MIKLAVIDDDIQILDIVCRNINSSSELAKRLKIYRYTEAEQLLSELEKGEKYNIILSDIELENMQGIEFGKIIKEKYPECFLVFLTAFPSYAAQSYVINAYQYILKSEIPDRLITILSELVNKIDDANEKYVMVKTRYEVHKVLYRDIIYIKKMKGEKNSVFCTTLGECRERVPIEQIFESLDSDEFIMVERGYIVNFRHIISLKGNEICLSNGETVTISRARATKVKDKICECWEKMQ